MYFHINGRSEPGSQYGAALIESSEIIQKVELIDFTGRVLFAESQVRTFQKVIQFSLKK